MKKTYQYYLKITKSKKQILEQQLKLCCWLYNYLLEQFRARDKNEEEQLTEYQLINSITKTKKSNPFLKQVQSNVLQDVAKRVYKAWQDYKKIKGIDPKKKYPNFKPHWRYNSLTYSQPIQKSSCGYRIDNSLITKRHENRKLKLTFGQQNHHNVYLELKVRIERNFEGDVKTLTIKRKSDEYYTLFSCDNIEPKLLPKTNEIVGIDVNLEKKSYITLSNGKKYKHPNSYRKNEKNLIEISKSLSHKVKGSQNWLDTRLQLNKKWEKVVNQFKHEVYQIAKDLVKNYDTIKIERLLIKNMVKNPSLAKSIQQARWGILFQVLADKASIAGRQLVRVNYYNTSQKCSHCSELTKIKLELKDRIFNCWNCKLELDRDINSAKNILNSAEIGSTRTLLGVKRWESSCSSQERGKYLWK